MEHRYFKKGAVEKREYQEALARSVLEKGSSLIVMPTGLGKTIVAARVIADKIDEGKVLFLAPTKPLAVQHAKTLREILSIPPEEIVVFTGSVNPEKRKELWGKARVVVATPQTVENDIIGGRIDLGEVSLLVFDEAHRAVGDYAYVFIAREYVKRRKNPLILGLTASPGGDPEKIREVMRNLYLGNVEIKTPWDEDVRPYVQKVSLKWIHVSLPSEFLEVRSLLERFAREVLKKLYEAGYAPSKDLRAYGKKDILQLQEKIRERILQGDERAYEASALVSALIKILHALELLETQGIHALYQYFQRLKVRAARQKGARIILEHAYVQRAMEIVEELREKGVDHPKIEKLLELLEKLKGKKGIVFVQYRDTASRITDLLKKMGIRAERFVGQGTRMGDKGMSQKEQINTIERLKTGEIDVLVATSVAEEGLDIPEVDFVIFYEAIPSEIRWIQRKGRTGRRRYGEIYVLIAKGTRDEAYYWSARAKERRMIEELKKLRKTLSRGVQRSLVEYSGEKRPKVKVLVDLREKSSEVLKELFSDPEVDVELAVLPVGDYLISDRVVVERKTVGDFLQSIIDGRLFEQASRLKDFERPIVVVEGEGLYEKRNMDPRAVRGAISSLILDFGIPVLFTKSPRETALFIKSMAVREQREEKRPVRIRGEKKLLGPKEMKEFIVQSLPHVGPKTAKELLMRFGSVEGVFLASERELASVPGIGEKKAKEIRRVISEPYEEDSSR